MIFLKTFSTNFFCVFATFFSRFFNIFASFSLMILLNFCVFLIIEIFYLFYEVIYNQIFQVQVQSNQVYFSSIFCCFLPVLFPFFCRFHCLLFSCFCQFLPLFSVFSIFWYIFFNSIILVIFHHFRCEYS